MKKKLKHWLTAWRKPEFFLRLSLGAIYSFNAWHFLHTSTTDWGRIQGWTEAVLAVIMLIPFWPRKLLQGGSLAAAIEVLVVFKVVGVNAESFPIIAMLGAALALFNIYERPPRGGL